ncbi:ribosomal protein S18-alanine N-acetyltransferase [Planococcus sp. CP5-4]|uniref:ribosomal protein S18-alanine N-acetyltransferase n=1 Tax=unclassified Planococcus (in: firmicutes) TaxID=2662419 RepID=UPI001C21368E|nr:MULTISPECIES: ribosomal protein S18-alanine N-acetyltransferase [unclassified Planococcus (in: firmicutes)]MBU9674100.1 ribosomal protein S18-alanine N-acetyltransferase [Planococcus sp. CP5-4_YE]MBV0909971.1 ribosomal protein S18-alanine N-acetyltransferase [Planococcus sp. CP5-4_UN]MBW6064851.1 ribosomal protein S18-alanine N-acetyltransferase [Planococcus sp. CP5-4]
MSNLVKFRKMTIQDVDAVYEIEKQSFTLAWTKEAFEQEMLKNEFAYYVLAETAEGVIGYCGMWLVMDEAHITNIAISPQQRGNKYGKALMKEAMDQAKAQGAKLMTLEARVSNIAALNLYKKLGFQNGGIRKGYYTDNQEDAIVMWVNFDE